MPSVPQNASQVGELYESRRRTRDVEIAEMNQIEDAILHGTMPPDYQRLFTESDVKVQLRTIRSADDSLTKFLSEIPILPHVDVLGKREAETQRNKAELVEKVVHGWHNGSAMRGGTDFSGIAFQLATHQVRFSDGCVLVCPDYDRKLIYLQVIDPRFHFPPEGYHPFSEAPLDGTLLVAEMTLGQVKRMFAYDSYGQSNQNLQKLNNAFAPHYGPGGSLIPDDSRKVKLGIYRSRAAWFATVIGEKDVNLLQSQEGDLNHPGVCGVMSLKQFGRGLLFSGQLGIEAAAMKVLNQQIQNTERINKATTYGPPLLHDHVIGGYNEINYALLAGRPANFYRNAPDSPNNLTQVLGQLLSLSENYNYNPESSMGGGPAVSGKAIQQLQAGPRTLVTNILFAPYKPAFPRIYDDCLEMELNLWPNERKTISGYRGRERFEVPYTPSTALQGYKGHIKIEEARAGGYNAFLEAVQKRDAGMASLRDVLEQDPEIRNVEQTIRRIESEQNEKFTQTAFEALGGQDPLLAIRASAEIDKRISNGKSKAEAIRAMTDEGFFNPPVPEEQALPELPPELMGAMGEEMPAPASLAEARGY